MGTNLWTDSLKQESGRKTKIKNEGIRYRQYEFGMEEFSDKEKGQWR